LKKVKKTKKPIKNQKKADKVQTTPPEKPSPEPDKSDNIDNSNKEKPQLKRKIGRPRVIDREAIKRDLLQLISHSNKSLHTCLEELKKTHDHVPEITGIFDWIHDDEVFANNYARAKEEQADFLVEEILQIADDDSEDAIFVEATDYSGKTAKKVCNNEFVQRSRLRVDTRKWIASKLKPKKYGDRLELDTPDGKPLVMITNAAHKK
jgi:hypothetical protein